MNQTLSIYLLIIAGILAIIALYGNVITKGTAALWVTAP